MIKVPAFAAGSKWAPHLAHPLFPVALTDHRQTLDIPEVFEFKLDVLPEASRIPPMEITHFEQHVDFSMFLNQSLNQWDKPLVVFLGEFAAGMNHHCVTVARFFHVRR